MSDIITLDSDDEYTAMPYNPADYSDLISNVSSGSHSISMSQPRQFKKQCRKQNNAFPKKPGALPPFALFCQEHRKKLVEVEKEMSFGELGRKMGEMWRALPDTEKDDYIRRARAVAEERMSKWKEEMKKIQPSDIQIAGRNIMRQNSMWTGANTNVVTNTFKPKTKRRTHGFAVFNYQMRLKYSMQAVPPDEIAAKVADEWRNASKEVHRSYEMRARRINVSNGYESDYPIVNESTHTQQKFQRVKNLRLQRQTQRRMGHNFSVSSSFGAVRPNLNLPSSITISKVEPEVVILEETKSGLPRMPNPNTLPPPPPMLHLGGKRQSKQSRLNHQPAVSSNSTYERLGSNKQLSVKSIEPGMPHLRKYTKQRPRVSIDKLASSLTGSEEIAISHKATPVSQFELDSISANDRLCKLCSVKRSEVYYYKHVTEKISKVENLLGVDVKLFDQDMICGKCFTLIWCFNSFRTSIENGQAFFKREKEAKNESETVMAETELDMQCEVENEPSDFVGVKQEEKEDLLLSTEEENLEQINTESSTGSVLDHQSTVDDDAPIAVEVPDPLMMSDKESSSMDADFIRIEGISSLSKDTNVFTGNDDLSEVQEPIEKMEDEVYNVCMADLCSDYDDIAEVNSDDNAVVSTEEALTTIPKMIINGSEDSVATFDDVCSDVLPSKLEQMDETNQRKELDLDSKFSEDDNLSEAVANHTEEVSPPLPH